MNKKIHPFTISGVIGDDSQIIKQREHFEKLIVQTMRDKGYVPALDLTPQFHISYVEPKNQYGFVLTIYGVFVGKAKAHKIEGWSGQQFIKR